MSNIENILNSAKNIHFIGIGGSGMCPMAEILLDKGYNITGSDNYISDTLQRLIDKGMKVYTEHNASNLNEAELVVYSAAIKENNVERTEAAKRGLPCIERAVMLGLLCAKYKNTVAVSGTHGKTTTTAMITQILTMAKKDPSAIIGGKLPAINGNSRMGKSDIIVCEACEYVDSFLQITPSIAVITNVEADHLDYFENLENVINSFNKFAKKATELVVTNGEDENSVLAAKNATATVVTFGESKDNAYYAENISEENVAFPSFDLMKGGKKLAAIKLAVPGKYNVYNALAAATVADCLGVSPGDIARALSEFTGVHRRFEVLGRPHGITVADDFAHHPTEITSVLTAAKKMGFKRVIAVFQPHTYSRTAAFLNEFAESLSIADITVLSEILAVREVNTYNIKSEDLAAKLENCICLRTFEEITDCIEKIAEPGDLVLTMGGGNVYVCANMILKRLAEK